MAGTRHHILPRFLLKGFGSRIIEEKAVFTWVHRVGGKPFEANINNVNVERHFYGRVGELNIDDEITSLEYDYATLLDELRNKDDMSEITDSRVPNLIAHFCTRTRHLRDSFRESSDFLIEQIFSYLADYNNVKAWVLNHPSLIQEELERIFENFQLPPIYKETLFCLIQNMTADLLDSQRTIVETFVQSMSNEMRGILPSALKEGHIKALSKEILPNSRVEKYRELRWFIKLSDTSLILGDTGCLFETNSSKRFKSLNDKEDDIENIYLPISTNRMLIGTSLVQNKIVDGSALNEAVAKCSREFFICSERSEKTQSLQALLGKDAEIISKKEIEEMLEDIFASVR